ncbi:MAG TPA: ROK family protein [Rhodospirillales bacterium]|jgi:fructokinase|nr:hypothetical protein [Rhodospirillaceae bacterium]HJN23334.1 ROK family protein [Rhodospirillales bacterium]
MRIGIDLGGSKIEGIVLDDGGGVLARRRVPTPQGDYDATVTAVAGLVAGLEQKACPAASIGVGIPGAISPASGLVKNANSTCLIGRPLDKDLPPAMGRDQFKVKKTIKREAAQLVVTTIKINVSRIFGQARPPVRRRSC